MSDRRRGRALTFWRHTRPARDPELVAMEDCLKSIEPLSAEARRRVIDWLRERSDEMIPYVFHE